MGCDPASIPQPGLSWPEFPELLLVGLGLNLIIYGVNMGLWRIASRRQVTVMFFVTTLIIVCGYYINDGIANPWMHAIDQWEVAKMISGSCSSPALHNALASSVAAAYHLSTLGLLLNMAAFLVWLVARIVWSYRLSRHRRLPSVEDT
jgi:uncharacterized membrane protein